MLKENAKHSDIASPLLKNHIGNSGFQFEAIPALQPQQDKLAKKQPTAGLSSLNGYESEYENGMKKSETELIFWNFSPG